MSATSLNTNGSKVLLTRNTDEKTRFTASDSLISKYWSNHLGYISDPFIDAIFDRLTKINASGANLRRRSPIMNRGYYARMQSMNKVLTTFLDATIGSNNRQIINLGAGFDSSALLPYYNGQKNLTTFEVDFAPIIAKKTEMFLSIPSVVSLLCSDSPSNENSHQLASDRRRTISSSVCSIGPVSFIAQDLRSSEPILRDLLAAGFDVNVPTLVITECVLVYVNKEHVTELCAAMSSFLQGPAVWLTYDMIHPEDMYGVTMTRNLKQMGFHIPGFAEYPTLEAQRQRFLETGWSECGSSSMLRFYDSQVKAAQTEEEQRRVNKIEIFDEFEEWNLLMGHYSLTVALKRSSEGGEAVNDLDEQLSHRLMSMF